MKLSQLLISSSILVATLATGAAHAQSELYSFDGSAADELYGRSVNVAGDIDQDGVMDLIIAATGAGFVEIRSGATGDLLRTLVGRQGEEFGLQSAACGDVNKDGVGDVIVGASWDSTNGFFAGRAIVFSGLDGSELHVKYGDDAFNLFGASVLGTGDLDGDGHADFMVGAPSLFYDSFVRVFSGATGAILKEWNPGIGSFGSSLALIGDLDGDGAAEFLVGSPSNASTGTVGAYSSLTFELLYEVGGDSSSDFFGYAVAAGGDVNGDSVADFIVGAPRFTFDGHGYARACSGSDGSTLFTFLGDHDPTQGDDFARTVGHAGDVNGDGVDDFLVGAPFEDHGPSSSGRATLYSGKTGRLLYAFDGKFLGAELGYSVQLVPDLNADGFAEVLLGIPGDNEFGFDVGRASVFGGNDLFHFSQPRSVAAGEVLTHMIREDAPLQPTILVLTSVNGKPTFLIVGGVGLFDDTGTRSFSAMVPAGLSGFSISHQSYALDASGSLIDSGDEIVDFE